MIDHGQYHNQSKDLQGISERKYETIFKMYTQDDYPFYNILQQIIIPQQINARMYSTIKVKGSIPYSVLSHQIYKDISLWWLICLANNIDDPTQLISPGTSLTYIKPNFVNQVMTEIKSKIKSK